MCGLAGFLILDNGDADEHTSHTMARCAGAMAQRLAHRGPDDEGVWVDAAAGIALAHRRLAIIDLSPAGHQPMLSSCGRFVIAYNGEVYNAAELRADLEARGRRFRGYCDTEVIVEACATWGVEATLERLIGMFAFALWDRRERRLTLARDRLGIKPVYWGRVGNRIAFASELKALAVLPDWSGEIAAQALALYLRYNYVPSPLSIFEGIEKLPPGNLVTIAGDGQCSRHAYWSLEKVAKAGLASPLTIDDAEAEERLENVIANAVKGRMISDAPIGAFLSGGIDSSLVVALMQRAADKPVRTFSIGFREAGYDEAPHARAIARHLETDHTEHYVDAAEAQAVIPRLPQIYDEPFADSSQIPTFLLCKITRRHVTVALSGDGGDELFAGYDRYGYADLWRRRLARIPRPLRQLAGAGIALLSREAIARLLRRLPVPRLRQCEYENLSRLALYLRGSDQALYRDQVSIWQTPPLHKRAHEARLPASPLSAPNERPRLPDYLGWMQYADMRTYLPDDILTKVDRASMAVALEVRVPLLDHRIVELSWRLPTPFKRRDGKTKWLLRRVLARHVPEELYERPKMGFGVPIGDWLRGPLRDWAEDLLSEKRLATDGYLDPAPIRRKWRAHLSAERNWMYPLWTVLMYQAWRADGLGGARLPLRDPKPTHLSGSGLEAMRAQV